MVLTFLQFAFFFSTSIKSRLEIIAQNWAKQMSVVFSPLIEKFLSAAGIMNFQCKLGRLYSLFVEVWYRKWISSLNNRILCTPSFLLIYNVPWLPIFFHIFFRWRGGHHLKDIYRDLTKPRRRRQRDRRKTISFN